MTTKQVAEFSIKVISHPDLCIHYRFTKTGASQYRLRKIIDAVYLNGMNAGEYSSLLNLNGIVCCEKTFLEYGI